MNASNIFDRHSNQRRLNAVTILQRHTRKKDRRDYNSCMKTVQAVPIVPVILNCDRAIPRNFIDAKFSRC